MEPDRTLDDFGFGSIRASGHATESTVLDLFNKELSKKVKVLTQMSYPQLSGRKQPDATLGEKQNYFIEAKWEGNETKGLVQAARYQRLGGKGIFVVTFSNRLRRSMPQKTLVQQALNSKINVIAVFNDDRVQDFFSGSMNSVVTKISKHVLYEIPVAEVKTEKVISILQNAVNYISAALVGVSEQSIDEIFGGKSVFENILQFEEKKYPLKEMRKGAAYLLLNQILFYHLLSKARPKDFLELEEDNVKSFDDLQIYFDAVLKIDYKPTFGFKIACKLPQEAFDSVIDTINIVKALRPEKIKHDVLGKIFHKLIPFEIRKAVAAFYTNNEAGALLAKLAINNSNDKIIDLACGSGTLLVSAYQIKKDLLQRETPFTSKYHVRFLERELTGIDIMPFAAHLAAVHLSLQEPLYETQRVRLAVWDSTEPTVRPGKVVPTISRELQRAYSRPKLDVFVDQKAIARFSEKAYIKKGSLTIEGIGGDELPLDYADVVIMNPPFTRQERLPSEYKNKLLERFAQYSSYLSGQMGLHCYFLLLADIFLRKGGRIAFVLPASVLRLKSAEGIRKFLAKNYRLDYIITTEQRSAFSESARFREILLVATKTKNFSEMHQCLFANLKRLPSDYSDSGFFADEIISSKEKSEELNDLDLSTKFVSQSELEKSTENWFKELFMPKGTSLLELCLELSPNNFGSLSSVLKSLNGNIVRGIEHWTGRPISVHSAFILSSKDHAIKSSDKWLVSKIEKDSIVVKDRFLNNEIEVPKKHLASVLRRPSGLHSIDITEQVDYAIVSRFSEDQYFYNKKLAKKGYSISKYMKEWQKYLESRKTHGCKKV
jgi:type I restriction-modification system DNA methylase subunit